MPVATILAQYPPIPLIPPWVFQPLLEQIPVQTWKVIGLTTAVAAAILWSFENRKSLYRSRLMAGIVTLLMVFVTICIWCRSLVLQDDLYILRPDRAYVIESKFGGIQFENHSPTILFPVSGTLHWVSHSFDDGKEYGNHLTLSEHADWNCLGFRYHNATDSFPYSKTIEIWRVPYWSIVLPLTLFSAFLILGNPRKRKRPDVV